MKVTLGFSTCPNDTFIFDALVHQKIDTEGLIFDVVQADVEELNHRASVASMDITKISYFAFAFLADRYQILDAGSALGFKNGPLLIGKQVWKPEEIPGLQIAIPGIYTTANLLFSIQFPEAKIKRPILFSEIENAILKEEVQAGVIIHENRFTYEPKGLKKIIDLGEEWEKNTGQPIPLGGIAVNRNLPKEIRVKAGRVIKRSVEYALNNPDDSLPYIKTHARELDDEVVKKHIELYVNDFTLSLGENGHQAIDTLYRIASEKGIIAKLPRNIFSDPA
jgi:1,4-dihydroxy-6-naphthoate synthase